MKGSKSNLEIKKNILTQLQSKYNIKLDYYNDYLYTSVNGNKKKYFLLVLKEEVTFNYLNKIINILKEEESLLYPLTFITNKSIDASAKEFISLFNGDLDILKIV